MTRIPTLEDIADLDGVDISALQLALDLTLANDPPEPGRVEQVMDFLHGVPGIEALPARPWREVAEFCAYHQQMRRLNLHPAQSPPCWIVDEDEADKILNEGYEAAADGSGVDISNCPGARLLKEMLRYGVSPFDPNPLAAIERAKQK